MASEPWHHSTSHSIRANQASVHKRVCHLRSPFAGSGSCRSARRQDERPDGRPGDEGPTNTPTTVTSRAPRVERDDDQSARWNHCGREIVIVRGNRSTPGNCDVEDDRDDRGIRTIRGDPNHPDDSDARVEHQHNGADSHLSRPRARRRAAARARPGKRVTTKAGSRSTSGAQFAEFRVVLAGPRACGAVRGSYVRKESKIIVRFGALTIGWATQQASPGPSPTKARV
jgi:hypothetical protein